METKDKITTKIIAIEGIDGAGKGLQYEMLKAKFEKEGKKCLALSFPSYDSFFGKEIGRMLSGKDVVRADELDSKSMALWYAMDRFKTFENLNIKEYDYVLLNRYILSNAVYQGIRVDDREKNNFIKWVFELENKILGLPEPHINFIMDIDNKTSKENVKSKGYRDYTGDEPDVYEKSQNIMENARLAYLEFSRGLKNVYVIKCMNNGKMETPDAIHEMVIEVLKENGMY